MRTLTEKVRCGICVNASASVKSVQQTAERRTKPFKSVVSMQSVSVIRKGARSLTSLNHSLKRAAYRTTRNQIVRTVRNRPDFASMLFPIRLSSPEPQATAHISVITLTTSRDILLSNLRQVCRLLARRSPA